MGRRRYTDMGAGLAGKDDRPRIHIKPTGDCTVAWQIGVDGRPRYSGTAGQALDEALAMIGGKDAVIFWEGRVE